VRRRAAGLLAAAALLAACGLEGPPIRPEPPSQTPAERPEREETGVTVSGSGYIGAAWGR